MLWRALPVFEFASLPAHAIVQALSMYVLTAAGLPACLPVGWPAATVGQTLPLAISRHASGRPLFRPPARPPARSLAQATNG